MAKGRKPIVIDKTQFQEVVTKIEQEGQVQTQNQLWKAVAATDWAKSLEPRPLTNQVAAIKAREMGIVVNLQKTKIGDYLRTHKIERSGGPRTKRRIPLDVVDVLKHNYDKQYHKTIDKAAEGSWKAKVKLSCLNCCAGEKYEIKACTLKHCIWWSDRPYQDDKSVTLETVTAGVEIEE